MSVNPVSGVPETMCRESVEVVGEIATCALHKGHGGKHLLLWEGDPAAIVAGRDREWLAALEGSTGVSPEIVRAVTHACEQWVGSAIATERKRIGDAIRERVMPSGATHTPSPSPG